MTATLRLTSPPEMGPGGRHLVLDCLHGTTYLDQLVPPRGSRVILSERAMIAMAVEKQWQVEPHPHHPVHRGPAGKAAGRRGGGGGDQPQPGPTLRPPEVPVHRP